MVSLRKALIYGVVVWLVPFAVAFAAFPLRESNRPLFESIMPVAVAGAVAGCAVRYFRVVTTDFKGEGLRLGLVWLLISVVIDAPLMLLGGPMHMSIGQYLADIGVTYLLMPVITVGIGVALEPRAGRPGP
jgi:hypothetical protein